MNGLVLSGGGARAAYQVGVLSYIAEKAPEVIFPIITGVSAGAINAVFLATYRSSYAETLERLLRAWAELTVDNVFQTSSATLTLNGARWMWVLGGGGGSFGPVRGLVDTSPLRRFLEERLDIEQLEANVRACRLRALALSAIHYGTGRTISFVHGKPQAPTWERVQRAGQRAQITVDHVMASAALPLIFPAIRVDGEYYGDGSIRQAAPLAPAIHLGADRLLAIATKYHRSRSEATEQVVGGSYPPPAQILGLLFHSIFMDTLESDAERLAQVNRALEELPPGQSVDGLRPIKLLVVRPSRDLGKLVEPFRDRLPRSLRRLLRGLGVHRVRGADFLSYLMFEEPFTSRMIELGYEDALSQWGAIERFLAESS